jgi:G:T-mismatch repair DNA endonuclease (very short patch repair protein)
MRKHNQRRAPSGLEIAVYEMLDEAGIVYQKEMAIGQCHVDIFFPPKTVIELNGCFWHSCAICQKQPLTKAQLAVVQKDANRYAFLKSAGFDVIVIWEHDLRDAPSRVHAMLEAIAQNGSQ